eukprot:1797240-Rhodomonas_salina.1
MPRCCRAVGADLALQEEGLLKLVGPLTDFLLAEGLERGAVDDVVPAPSVVRVQCRLDLEVAVGVANCEDLAFSGLRV